MISSAAKSLGKVLGHDLFIMGAIWFSVIANYFKTTFLPDWFLIEKIIWLILFDTALGLWKSIKQKEISLNRFACFFVKVILYGFFILAVSLLSGVSYLEYLIPYILGGIIIHELLSVIRNISILMPKLVPVWIKKLFSDFDKNGIYVNKNQQVQP